MFRFRHQLAAPICPCREAHSPPPVRLSSSPLRIQMVGMDLLLCRSAQMALSLPSSSSAVSMHCQVVSSTSPRMKLPSFTPTQSLPPSSPDLMRTEPFNSPGMATPCGRHATNPSCCELLNGPVMQVLIGG